MMTNRLALDDEPLATSGVVTDRLTKPKQSRPFQHQQWDRRPDRQSSAKQTGKPEANQHLPVLDAWRGMAVVLLMIGHFFPIYRIDCGALGVELFFVLSGFLMGRILFVKETPLKVFYQRRVSRIFPAAYVFLFAMLGWRLLSSTGTIPSVTSASACFLFFSNYLVAMNPATDLGMPAGHFWSLCVEEHTYIYLSLLSLFHRRLRIKPLMLIGGSITICFANSVIFGRMLNWDPYQVYWRTDCRAASILLGAAAACLAAGGVGIQRAYYRIPTIALGALAVCCGVLFRLQFFPEFIKYSLGTGLLAVGLLLIATHGRGFFWAFPPLAWIGTVSFSVYLWQQPFYIAVHNGQLNPFVAVIGAFATGLLSYWLIEKPARSWINRRFV